jgi:hypothetical protein
MGRRVQGFGPFGAHSPRRTVDRCWSWRFITCGYLFSQPKSGFDTNAALTGGINYLAPRVGLAVNQIVDVQMVLASGQIVNTNDKEYADLNKAIRGGGNNFGVATSFEIICTASNGSYGGVMYYPLNTTDQQLKAIHNFTADNSYDENATALLSFGYSNGQALALNNIVYTAPVSSPPTKLQQFTEIPSLFNTLRPATMFELANETAAAGPHGFRYYALPMKVNEALANFVI